MQSKLREQILSFNFTPPYHPDLQPDYTMCFCTQCNRTTVKPLFLFPSLDQNLSH